MEIKIPELSLVVLVGASGSGKSSFAKKHFQNVEIISSDECRGMVSNDENNQAATNDAFDVLHYITEKRLKNGLLTVIDATNVQKESRKELIEIAKRYHCLPVAIVLDISEAVCKERNQIRADRNFGNHVIRNQIRQLKKSLRSLKEEGFKQIYTFQSETEVESIIEIKREKLYNNKTEESGPFDIIGDVHGCFDELYELLLELGYSVKDELEETERNFGFQVTHAENRKVVFLGDLVDRGPDSPQVLRLVMSMVDSGMAYCVPGNHDLKLQKYLSGKKVQIRHGLQLTIQQLETETPKFKAEVEKFLYSLISHYVFDNGKLVVAHAGLKEEMQGRASGTVRSFCLYGETTGEIDEFGLPVRLNWAKEYRGRAKVVYGHTPVLESEWLNRTIDIDTGCVFGGKLTALRYPEEELISVHAKKMYYEPRKPLEQSSTMQLQHEADDVLDIDDIIGKRIIQTRLRNNIIIREENSIAALEVMSRFAVHPKWLIYLPPTMSPCQTSKLSDYLEHPIEALNYYQKHGVEKVVCEEKHMGSRVVLIVCKDEDVVRRRFGIDKEGIGVCYTRTGRRFFKENNIEKEILKRINAALSDSKFWEKFQTEWVCLDAELMPWSAKAIELIKSQYASVGSAAKYALNDAKNILLQTANRGIEEASSYIDKFEKKEAKILKYIKAYQKYCWTVESMDDYKIAPFHILATENEVHSNKTHEWHLKNISDFCRMDEKILLETPYRIINLNGTDSFQEAIDWWQDLTNKGSEGMVIKPYDFVSFDRGKLVQAAVKCRGQEYLRIIYGPEYDLPENLEKLKNRGLARKQSLALKEFALGLESLERFVRKEPLRRIHESVFGVLALESEDVDPRL